MHVSSEKVSHISVIFCDHTQILYYTIGNTINTVTIYISISCGILFYFIARVRVFKMTSKHGKVIHLLVTHRNNLDI